MKIIAHLPLNRGKEPLVRTTSLRKNINSKVEITKFKEHNLESLTRQPNLIKLLIRQAAQSMGQRCGAILERLFRIFAKTTPTLKEFKMEAKFI